MAIEVRCALEIFDKARPGFVEGHRCAPGQPYLQIVLWTLWSLLVAVVGYLNWHADVIAQRPTNTLGLAIHCVVAGLIGLVVMTLVEMQVEPWRFMDKE